MVASLAASLFAGGCVEGSLGEPSSLENGAIVFAASSLPDYGPVQLYSMQVDGSQLRQLTDDISYKTAVATAPDGSRIAYAAIGSELTEDAPAPEPSSIFVMEADGSGRRELCRICARTGYAFEPEDTGFEGIWYDDSIDVVPNSLAWSPTGATLAAPAVTPGVLLIDVETGETTTIETPEPITAIAWSPDGRWLALSHTWFSALVFTSRGIMVPPEGTMVEREPVTRPGGIYVLDLETDQIDEVVSSPGLAHVNGWSSDGDRLAFTHMVDEKRTGQISAYSVGEDRSWTLVPGERGAAPLGVGWSPGDDSLAALIDQYDEESQSAKDLWITSSTNVDPRALPICRFDGAFDGDQCAKALIAWSPDGTTVAYRAILHGTPVRSAVILQAIDGSPADVVMLDGVSFDIGEGCCLTWLPAS